LDWKKIEVVREKPARQPQQERIRGACIRLAEVANRCQVSRNRIESF
jgi:hypothetical protein